MNLEHAVGCLRHNDLGFMHVRYEPLCISFLDHSVSLDFFYQNSQPSEYICIKTFHHYPARLWSSPRSMLWKEPFYIGTALRKVPSLNASFVIPPLPSPCRMPG